ncbi:LAFE_0D06260g1_1 [Lachancea fermentati]|uniref:Regulator of rDNA transcription protein 5 n=1 Tax=Lachancea fermentati TaxID=4955 RepID=A0A1G4MBM1_LACFM|nr:LAFE_0D06260g1_1 [Lachancea fermentati]
MVTESSNAGSQVGSTPIPVASNRVYISNLSFNATEEELSEFLSSYNVKSVLIPSQTIRGFRKSTVRPLGIAYAEFETGDETVRVIQELNGTQFKERVLKIKPYVPYSPCAAEKRPNRGTKGAKNQQSEVPEELRIVQADDAFLEEEMTVVAEPQVKVNSTSQQVPLSEDTVYCAYLPGKVTDVELREFFKDYEPQDIYVFRSNGTRRGIYFHRCFTAALVTLGNPEFLLNAISNLRKQKLMGKRVTLRVARLSKIQEVQRAAVKKLEEENLRLQADQPQVGPSEPVAAN